MKYKNKYNIITFIDSMGRTILGEKLKERSDSKLNTTFVQVKTPIMLTIQFDQNNRMVLDTIPLFFPEFINSDNDTDKMNYTVEFNKFHISIVNVEVSENILKRYFTGFNVKSDILQEVQMEQKQNEESKRKAPPRIKLFENK